MRNTTERRQEVLYFISDRRRVTYQQIADEFNISYHVPKNFEKCSDYCCGIYCGILDTLCSIFRTFSQI